MMMNNLTKNIDFLSGLLTPAIALFLAYIAWRQYVNSRYRLKFDLYNKRYKIYDAVNQLSTNILKSDKPKEALLEFNAAVNEKDFLFDKEVLEYLDQLRLKATELVVIREK